MENTSGTPRTQSEHGVLKEKMENTERTPRTLMDQKNTKRMREEPGELKEKMENTNKKRRTQEEDDEDKENTKRTTWTSTERENGEHGEHKVKVENTNRPWRMTDYLEELTQPKIDGSPSGEEGKDVEPPLGPSNSKLALEDVINYLDDVKFTYRDRPKVYQDFLQILKRFKSQSLKTEDALLMVTVLFKEHPLLVLRFGAFLSPEYKMDIVYYDGGHEIIVDCPRLPLIYNNITE